jgi:hypothetical protein
MLFCLCSDIIPWKWTSLDTPGAYLTRYVYSALFYWDFSGPNILVFNHLFICISKRILSLVITAYPVSRAKAGIFWIINKHLLSK